MNPPPSQLVIRIGQVDPAGDGSSTNDPPLTGSSALYRLVSSRMPVCAKHLLELGMYQPEEARVVLTTEQIDALVVEFGLRRDDLMTLHGPRDPFLGGETCRMCETLHVDGNLCHHDGCRRRLHPRWPVVYCSDACARDDA
jgi:hypothetical protein